jgi:hypothetical protein
MKRIKYQLQALSQEQRMLAEYILLDEMDKQRWFGIVYLEIWKSEGYISIH